MNQDSTITIENDSVNPMIIPLTNIDQELLVRDMNYEFKYQRLIKPDNTPSNLFTLMYRNVDAPNWFVKNGLLSNFYSVAKTELLIEKIKQSLQSQVESERHFRHTTIVRSSFTLSGFELDLIDDSESNRIIFNLITNINPSSRYISNGKISFNITNDFSGGRKLEMSYGFVKNIYPEGHEDSKIQFNNLFLLDEFTYDLLHNSKLTLNYSQVQNIRNSVQSRIDRFKSINVNAALIDDFNRSFTKVMMKRFMHYYDRIPEVYRNFYYCSFIWTAVLSDINKLNYENSVRALIKKKISDRFPEETP